MSPLKAVSLISMAHSTHNSKTGGFALLITLLVVSVLIAIGLTVLDLTIKQVRLSSNAKESETAFHAANAGVECGRYWRRIASSTMESGGAISPTCFSASPYVNTKQQINSGVSGNGQVYLYTYSFSWGAKPRCSVMQTLVMVATPLGGGLTLANVPSIVPGYPNSNPKTCTAGERCTILSTRGYNRNCDTVSGYGSVEREVLLQF